MIKSAPRQSLLFTYLQHTGDNGSDVSSGILMANHACVFILSSSFDQTFCV
jgi:hypothetical protein